MPSPYLTPYVPQQYDRGPSMRIVDLLQQGGDARARALLQKSQLWGQAIQQLGQIPNQIIEGRAAERESKARAEERQAQADLRRIQIGAMEAEADDKRAVGEALSAGLLLEDVEANLKAHNKAHLILPTREAWLKSDEIASKRRKARLEEADSYLDTAILGLAPYLDDEDGGLSAAQLLAQKAKSDGMEDALEGFNPAALQDPRVLRQEYERVRLERTKPIAGDKPLVVQQPDGSYKEVYTPAPKPPASLDAAKAAAYAAGDMGKVAEITRLQAQEAAATRAPQRPQYSAKTVMLNGEEKQVNYDETTGKYYDMDTGAVLSNVAPAPTADMRNKKEGRKLVSKSINAIKDLSTQIITKVGPAQRADAIRRGAEAVFGSDPEFRTYQDARTALAGNLAVAQQGSRPSDADIKAIWLPLVPDAYRDTSESARLKWSLIETMSNVDDAALPQDAEEFLKTQDWYKP